MNSFNWESVNLELRIRLSKIRISLNHNFFLTKTDTDFQSVHMIVTTHADVKYLSIQINQVQTRGNYCKALRTSVTVRGIHHQTHHHTVTTHAGVKSLSIQINQAQTRGNYCKALRSSLDYLSAPSSDRLQTFIKLLYFKILNEIFNKRSSCPYNFRKFPSISLRSHHQIQNFLVVVVSRSI